MTAMDITFYIASVVAVVASILMITRASAVHALLYMLVSLLSVAVIFYILGAPFIAALEVIIYGGAIMVLFVFVIMMVNVGPEAARQEAKLLAPRIWIGPSVLAGLLLAELIYMAWYGFGQSEEIRIVEPKAVGMALFGPYLLGVELSSLLLLAGLIGAWHLGRHRRKPRRKEERAPW
jgi:NADH-quinone oxidoreductase subunit J